MTAPTSQGHSPPLYAIALLSTSVLGYEILLMRLFSIVQWHHFAYMMISLALLGYGAAGTFVALCGEWLSRRYPAVFVVNTALFGVSALAAFLLAQRVPFNALEIFWDPQQPRHLLVMYLLLFVPFFLAGSGICLTFTCCGGSAHRIYSYDLLGAAGGCLVVMALLFLVPPMRALQALAALGLLAAALAALHFRLRTRITVPLLAAGALLVVFALPDSLTGLRLSEYKSLSQQLLVPGARVIEERSSPLGLLSVVESPRIPFRHAPGLSLNAAQEPPAQLGVYTDGDGFSALTRFDGDLAKLDYLDQMTSALPYHLLEKPRVAVLGAGAGADVLQAVQHGASRIDAVELDPQMMDLVRERHAGFAGNIYARPEVRLHLAEARGFVAASGDRYDLIHLALLDAFGASAAGLYGLNESYLYTVEGLQRYLEHLQPDGILSITRWVTLPPRDTLKLFATAVAALERNGVADPGRQLAMIRGWQTVTLLVRNGEFVAGDIERLRAFSEARSFDTEWYPGMRREQANRYNLLDEPWFHDGAVALLGKGRARFTERYKFNIAPATDDRPYFFNFFRWGTLAEILRLKERGGLPLLELGYPVLIATLAQALLASVVLILLPLALRRSQRAAVPRGRVFVYFAALGFAFMFIEMAFIQRFTLLLAHPLYAVAVVLCAFLLFAGLGARWSGRHAAGVRHDDDDRKSTDTPSGRHSSAGPPPEDVAPDRHSSAVRTASENADAGHAENSRPPANMRPVRHSSASWNPFSSWTRTPRTTLWPAVLAIVALSAIYLVALPPLFRHAVALPDTIKILLSAVLIAPLAFCMGMPFARGMAALSARGAAGVPWAYGVNACASVIGATLATVLAIQLGFSGVVMIAMVLYTLAAAVFDKMGPE